MAANQMGALEFLSKTFIHDRLAEYKILFEGGEGALTGIVKYN